MPAQPRKATPRKAPAAAVSARREVRAEKGKTASVAVKFRGETFDIARDRLGSARIFLLQRKLGKPGFGTIADEVEILFELLGQVDSARFINLVQPGDQIEACYLEFVQALNKAANVPNS